MDRGEALEESFEKRARFRPMSYAAEINDDGLVFGAGTILARMTRDVFGSPMLALDADHDRCRPCWPRRTGGRRRPTSCAISKAHPPIGDAATRRWPISASPSRRFPGSSGESTPIGCSSLKSCSERACRLAR